MVHPQETNDGAATGIFNQPLKPTRRKSSPSAPLVPYAPREKPLSEAEKRLDKSARYFEHCAPPADDRELEWRHGRWAARRQLVRRALESCGTSAVKLHNFDNCGAQAVSQWSEKAQRRRLSMYTCRCRHCEPCAAAKAKRIAGNLREKLLAAKFGEYRLITFTLKHSDAPLAQQIQRLYKSFKVLRGKKEWKRTQRGGAAILEVKWNGSHWHPHLHVIGEGDFILTTTLRHLWKQITLDSHVVDVKLLKRPTDAAAYVCKYITKSTSPNVWTDPSIAQEWLIASSGLRTANTYGTWRKYPLTAATVKFTDWVPEARLTSLLERAIAGEILAKDILNHFRPNSPYGDHEHHAADLHSQLHDLRPNFRRPDD